jgi:class 3 adenylate cyclase
MEFRIGINLGDVIEEGERIFGDGDNIAARLEGLAEAGGICISGKGVLQLLDPLLQALQVPAHRLRSGMPIRLAEGRFIDMLRVVACQLRRV